ncbi:hypothetical protein VA7868_03593 [Vibrio aerogenes CECT 7868]|uniref:YhhN-like protein n=1 Tax=Vibrio aerogenes CECT 7868 TaxID=1216006 RepID=A0A1M6AJP3_9VIBR|nr:hypothetical protein [Vibrio aerogenes]SHI36665.1 hypothetical protein VA7868_03593 [Vibrio aerogenes CECT 7868]
MGEKGRYLLLTAYGVDRPTRYFFYISIACTLLLLLSVTIKLPIVSSFTASGMVGFSGYLVFIWLFLSCTHQRFSFLAFVLTSISLNLTFWLRISHPVQIWLLISILAVSIVMLLLVLPRIDHKLFPVFIVGLLMVSFVWAACEFWLQEHSLRAGAGTTGTILWALVTFRVMLYPAYTKQNQLNMWVIVGYQISLAGIAGSLLW